MGFKLFVIPALVVGLIAGAITQNIGVGLFIMLVILIGNWIGFYFGKKKK